MVEMVEMAAGSEVLELFCPMVRRWFRRRFDTPTEVQQLAWPHIAGGEHVLATAPTGSGKTLTAFLWALDRLLTGAWPGGQVRVLYVSPLKALGNDIRRNLLVPLQELSELPGGEEMPQIRVLTRSGDTPAEERRRMQRHPPEILITTPESLNIMLTSLGGRELLRALQCVILDEVHAVAGSKRGAHLLTAVERLVQLSGEVQRLALSATVNPLDRIARWLGGYRLRSTTGEPAYQPRPVTVVRSSERKRYDLQISSPVADHPPHGSGERRDPELLWERLVQRLKATITGNRSTLIFANSRRLVEKVARMLNEPEPEPLAYSHHGSLSRELRSVVEERLKAGQLRAIVATSSLELGIDIGAIDEVALVSSPPSIAGTLQRLGRAGHGVGQTCRGRLYPLFARDLLEAAVLIRSVLDGDIEPIQPICNPLDLLAQVILSMTAHEPWPVDELYATLRCADPYHELPRHHFDLVLDMLAGRYATTRLRSLRPLVTVDRVDSTVRARPGADRLIYLAGGTIPDRGYYQLRLDDSGTPLGELDEEFVWERSVGDTFSLGVQIWKIRRITHNDVMVVPVGARAAMAPFWRADERDRSSFLSERVAAFLERAEERLGDETFRQELVQHHHLEPAAASELCQALREQRAACTCLPHRHRLVIERCPATSGRGDYQQTILHTLWGGRANRPLAYALAAAWQRRFGVRPDIAHDDDCIALTHPAELSADDPFALVPPESLETLLRQGVEETGFFGARFREAAGCALMLPRSGFSWNRRVPLWVNRQRAKELLEAVSAHDDFPLVLEAWRSCLHSDFELDVLQRRLEEVRDGRITVHTVHTDSPSPFAANALWRQTNRLMYEDDVPPATGGPRLRHDLLRELTTSSLLRPRLDPALVRRFQDKLQRLVEGYTPASASDLRDWVSERLLLPADEWSALLEGMVRDHDLPLPQLLAEVADRLLVVRLPGEDPGRETGRFVCSVEHLDRILASVGQSRTAVGLILTSVCGDGEPQAALAALQRLRTAATTATDLAPPPLAGLLAEWLRYYGPLPPPRIAATFVLPEERVVQAVAELAEQQLVVLDEITAGTDSQAPTLQVCDRENLERLLRLVRAEARPAFQPLPADALPLFLARQQRLGVEQADLDGLKQAMESLFGFPAGAELWESELLPARLDPYLPAWLDTLLSETDLRWVGCGERRLTFALEADRPLLTDSGIDPAATPADLDGATATADAAAPAEIEQLFPQGLGRYPFDALLLSTGLGTAELTGRLWRLAWQGLVSTDTFAAVRQGSAGRFKAAEPAPRGRSGRGRFDRWRSTRPFAGSWYRLPPLPLLADALEQEEAGRDRVRLLLDRYGVLFRELLDRELPRSGWRDVFRTLRIMELSGEVVAGRFFDGVPGIQFMSHSAFRSLDSAEGQPQDQDRIWWLNATDPASPCGLGLIGLPDLPRRVVSNHLVFHGRRLVVTSQGRGKRLAIEVAPDHPHLPEYLRFLQVLLTRPVQPLRSLTVETINEEPASVSPYRQPLADLLHVTRTATALRLSRRYESQQRSG